MIRIKFSIGAVFSDIKKRVKVSSELAFSVNLMLNFTILLDKLAMLALKSLLSTVIVVIVAIICFIVPERISGVMGAGLS